MPQLYIISSVFHFLLAVAHSLHNAKVIPYFALLKFNPEEAHKLSQLLQASSTLIDETQIFLSNNHKSRKTTAQQLLSFAQQHKVQHIYTGNDRHVEFQFLMYHLTSQNIKATYLDDGLYSYTGRSASLSLSDQLDGWLKKLYYGFWWNTPKTIGASKWISNKCLFYPEYAHPLLKHHHAKQLPVNLFTSDRYIDFAKMWLSMNMERIKLDKISIVITLPDLKTDSDKHQNSVIFQNLLASRHDKDSIIAVKYHPNAQNKDVLNLMQYHNVILLPSNIPFEIYLSALPEITLYTGLSTTLITANLINPKTKVILIAPNINHDVIQLHDMLNAINIQVVRYDVQQGVLA